MADKLSITKERTAELIKEFGKGEEEFAAILSDYAKAASPGATAAAWSS